MIGSGAPYRGSGTTAKIYQVLVKAKGDWCNRSKLHEQLGGHTSAEEISKSLAELEEAGLAEQRTPESKPTGGRRGEEWRTTSYELTELSEETSWKQVDESAIEAITGFLI
jgi:predicted transcriptional regulator